MSIRNAILLLLLLVPVGCGGDGSGSGDGDSEGAASSSPASAADAVSRIAVDPLPLGEIPAAIKGEAGPPQGEDVAYFGEDPETRGYLALPAGEGPFPAVILIHEWNGLVDRIRQTADALAREGYVALAADMYSGRTGSNRDENMALVQETRADPDRMIRNLNEAVEFLRARPNVAGPVGTMGWCYGGGVALTYALGSDAHDATAIFYGSLVTDPEVLSSLHHEVYGTFAEMDQGIPPEQVDQFVEALRGAGVPNDVHVYDAVNHGFWLYVDRDPENATGPAIDAWDRLRAYLDRTLRPNPGP